MNNSLDFLTVKDAIPEKIENDTIFNIKTRSVTQYTHGFHKYPAKFIPQIPNWAIQKYLSDEKGKWILDPFCGSGTTLVEGLLAGNNVIGLDIDPLSILITKVKTTPIDYVLFNAINEWMAVCLKGNQAIAKFKPDCLSISHWFTEDAVADLSRIRSLIDLIPHEFGDTKASRDIYDLLMVCFSSIIRRVSNADNESQKTYVSHTNVKAPEDTISLFLNQMSYFGKRILEFSTRINSNLSAQITCASSIENLSFQLKGRQVDLAITSPPYIKAIDYIYNQMAELFWIGDLFDMQTQTKQNKRKQLYVGTKHLPVNTYANYNPRCQKLDIRTLDEKIESVFIFDKKNGHKHSFIVYKYFTDMENHFIEMNHCLKSHAHYIMVVGDCSVSGVVFETPNYLSEIAQRNGFLLTGKWGYQIKNRFMRFDRKGRGGKIEIDWVLDLTKI
jgi:DNA modification methylase